jgi:hypothetical protein
MRQSSSQMEGGHQYLNGSPKAIFFTDFDGTVTLQDCKLYILTLFTTSCFMKPLLRSWLGNDYLVITYANNLFTAADHLYRLTISASGPKNAGCSS